MRLRSIVLHSVLALVACSMLAPLGWMLLLSLRSYPERYATLWALLQAPTTLANYVDILTADAFGRYMANSFLVAGCITVGNLLFSFAGGYALARFRFPGHALIEASVLAVLLIPAHVLMLPLYRLMVTLGWIDTYWALIVPWLVSGLGVFLLRQYFAAIPTELEDAARLDGAGPWQVLLRIAFPLARPALVMLGVTSFLTHWNAFLFPFLFTHSDRLRTLPVGLTFYISKQTVDWGHLMAGAALAALPVIVLFVLFRRYLVGALLAGALKQ